MRHAVGAVLPVALLTLIGSGAAFGGDFNLNCSQLNIRLVGIPEAADARCPGFGDNFATIGAGDESNIFIITHRSAVNRSYVLVWLSVKDMFDESTGFASTENWGEEFEVVDFDVRRFKGTLIGRDGPVACFGFVRYSGHETRPSGYRHVTGGVHCDLTGKETGDERLHQLISAIDADYW